MTETIRVRLPVAFRRDRDERALPTGWRVSSTITGLSVEDAREYLNDAEHYAHEHGPDCLPPGLKVSARATVRVLKAALAVVS